MDKKDIISFWGEHKSLGLRETSGSLKLLSGHLNVF